MARRPASFASPRRRFPRLFLDVDWFVESNGCSTLGRGLTISPHGALLPVTCVAPLSGEVTLHVSLEGRAQLFKARGQAMARQQHGWAIAFTHVTLDDLHLLATTLVDEFGPDALLPAERKPPKSQPEEGRRPRDSI